MRFQNLWFWVTELCSRERNGWVWRREFLREVYTVKKREREKNTFSIDSRDEVDDGRHVRFKPPVAGRSPPYIYIHSGWLDAWMVGGETPYAIIRFGEMKSSLFFWLSLFFLRRRETWKCTRSFDRLISTSLPPVPSPHSTRHRFIECRVNHPSQPPQSEWDESTTEKTRYRAWEIYIHRFVIAQFLHETCI